MREEITYFLHIKKIVLSPYHVQGTGDSIMRKTNVATDLKGTYSQSFWTGQMKYRYSDTED